jgi:hypothetical protein
VANTGLKVPGFSASCTLLVRVADNGLAGAQVEEEGRASEEPGWQAIITGHVTIRVITLSRKF